MTFNLGRVMAAALLLGVTAPVYAQSVEQATANITPWSGWWWPAKTGDLVLGYRGEPGALVKHDQVDGKQASQWEQHTYYHFDPQGAPWWGHCHAWAAASVLEPEPLHDVPHGGMVFHVGDIKGLLSEAHYSVWYVLRHSINLNKTPIIFDLNPGPEVWSYPVYKYQLSFQPIDAASYQSEAAAAIPQEKRQNAGSQALGNASYQGQLSLTVATFEVYPDSVGTAAEQHNYSFVFQASGNQLIMGSDHWTGASLQDHPDFAWYPTQRAQENPQLDYNLVSQLDQQAQ